MEFGCFSWVVTSPRTIHVPSLVVTFANSPFRSEPLGRGSRRAPGKMEAGQMRLDFATLELFYVLQRRNVQQKPARRNIEQHITHLVIKFSRFLVFCFSNQSCLCSSQGRVKLDDGVRILTATGSHILKHLLKFYKDMIGEQTSDVIQGQ